MGKEHRLGTLKMSVARHDSIFIFLGLMRNGLHQGKGQSMDSVKLLSCIEPGVQSHLIISAPGCVEHLSIFPDSLYQLSLHKGVDVFSLFADDQSSFLRVLQYGLQAFDYVFSLLLGNDGAFSKHSGMGYASCDVFPIHFPVEENGGVEAF